jgi:hypothetical protein
MPTLEQLLEPEAFVKGQREFLLNLLAQRSSSGCVAAATRVEIGSGNAPKRRPSWRSSMARCPSSLSSRPSSSPLS